MLYFSRGRIVNNSLQTSNLRQGNIKLLVASCVISWPNFPSFIERRHLILGVLQKSVLLLNPQSTAYGTNLSLGAVKLSLVWNIVTTYMYYTLGTKKCTWMRYMYFDRGWGYSKRPVGSMKFATAASFSLVSSGFSSSKYCLIYINKTPALKKV
jgi:hypothetical protein